MKNEHWNKIKFFQLIQMSFDVEAIVLDLMLHSEHNISNSRK